MDREKDKTLPFLDTLVIRTEEKLKFEHYKKPTHTDRYLDAELPQPPGTMEL
jgi:hypothetical protein